MTIALEKAVAVLVAQTENLTREFREFREASANRDIVREDKMNTKLSEMTTNIASVQRTLDMAKGGWIVLSLCAAVVAWASGALGGIFKIFHT